MKYVKSFFAVLALCTSCASAATLTKLWTYPIKASITYNDLVVVSEDGQKVAAFSSDKGTLYCFDAQGNLTWNYLAPRYNEWPYVSSVGLAASADFSRFYLAVNDNNALYVVNGEGQQILQQKFDTQLTACTLSGDGKLLWIGFGDGRVDCYQTGETLKKLWTFQPDTAGSQRRRPDIKWLSASRDGGACAVVAGYQQLYLLDASGKEIYSYPISDNITTAAVSGDGSVLAVATRIDDPYGHELILLPGRLEPGKALSPLRRQRFKNGINTLALTSDGSLTFVGLDEMIGTSFVVLDGRGAEQCAKDMGAAVKRLAVSKDGRYVAIVDGIGGKNLSFHEVSSGGAMSKLLGTAKTPKGTLPGEPRRAADPVSVLAGLFRISAILFFVLNVLSTLSLLVKKRKTSFTRFPLLSIIFIFVGAVALALSLGLPAMKKEPLVGAADALLLGGVLYLVQGIGIWVFALVYRGRFQEEVQKEQREMKLLAIVESRGQVKLDWLASELGLDRKALEEMIYQLVGEKRFRGYIDWKEGDLYAAQAKEIKENHCPHCGAEVEMVGKGVVKCPYCGAETFL
jgi:hypothetical protein